MSTDAQTRQRMNQVAAQKLAQLGVRTLPSADGTVLEGELVPPPGALINPLTGLPVERIRFEAEGHDRMRFMAPAYVARLPPLMFFELASLHPVWPLIAQGVRNGMATAQKHAQGLRRRGFNLVVDNDRGVTWAQYNIGGLGVFTVECNESGAFLVHVAPARPDRRPMALPWVPFSVDGLGDKTDLELHLGGFLEHAPEGSVPSTAPFVPPPLPDASPLQAATRTQPSMAARTGAALPPAPMAGGFAPLGTAPGSAPAQPPPAPAPAASLGTPVDALVARLGAALFLADGFTVHAELTVAGQAARFVARHQGGNAYHGTLLVAGVSTWEETFKLDDFPGVHGLLQQLSGSAAAPAPDPAPARGMTPAAGITAPGIVSPAFGPMPRPGEIWHMRVRVEQDNGAEVRYQAMDAVGRAYGAARVLGRAQFDGCFQPYQGAHRMLVRVLGVEPDRIAYTQLNPSYDPVEMPRVVSLLVFMGTFVPEGSVP